MSTQKKKPEKTSVEWAEKLKASMSTGYVESPQEAASAEEDDLAALLRAQLGKGSESDSFLSSLDTSDFEEEEDEDTLESFYDEESSEDYDEEASEDYDEKSPEDYDEEASEDYDEEFPEDYDEEASEDYDEEVSEDYDEESSEDYDEESSEDYDEESSEDYDEEVSEDYDEEASEDYDEEASEDYDEEASEDYDEEISEDYDEEASEDYDEEYDEEYDEDEPEVIQETEAFSEEETSSDAADTTTIMYYRRPVYEHLADDRLNGLSPNETVGGSRLQALDEQNTRLLEEENLFLTAWDSMTDEAERTTPSEESRDASASADAAPSSGSRKAGSRVGASHRPSIPVRDPLQLGLEDISPISAASAKPSCKDLKSEPDEAVPPSGASSNYTEIMTQVSESDEALRDTHLFMGLGYEEILRHEDEQDRVERIREDLYTNRKTPASGEIIVGDNGQEYRGYEDTGRVETAYVQAKRKNLARVCAAGLGALLAILYDLIPVLFTGEALSALLDPVWMAPVGLLLTVLICIPFATRLGKGLKSLADFEPTRYAVAGMGVVVSVLHGVVACFVGDPYKLPLFTGVSMLMLFVAALSELLMTEGEHKAFSVVSSGKTVHILTDECTPAAVELIRMQDDAASENSPKSSAAPKCKILTVVRAGRVADYFARTKQYNPYMGRLNYLIPVAFLAALVCAGAEILTGGHPLTDGVRVFTATYLLCLPAAYLLAMTLPLYWVNGMLSKKGSAVIGAAAPLEYAGKQPAHLIFDDGDALKSLYRKDITLRGDTCTEDCRRMADWIFRLLNTPLAVEPTIREGSHDDFRIEIAETQENYIRLYLTDRIRDKTTEVMMGSHEALTRNGIRLPKISMEQRYKKSAGSHVLYLAFNRSFHLAYAVEYRVGRTFAHVAMALSEMGHKVSISAYDPMIRADMEGIQRLRRFNSLEVVRPKNHESVRRVRSGGLIATGRSMDLLQPLSACRDMKRAYGRAHLMGWLSLLAGTGLSALAIVLGGEAFLISGLVAVWQILLSAGMFAISRTARGNKAPSRDTDKQKKPAEGTSAKQVKKATRK